MRSEYGFQILETQLDSNFSTFIYSNAKEPASAGPFALKLTGCGDNFENQLDAITTLLSVLKGEKQFQIQMLFIESNVYSSLEALCVIDQIQETFSGTIICYTGNIELKQRARPSSSLVNSPPPQPIRQQQQNLLMSGRDATINTPQLQTNIPLIDQNTSLETLTAMARSYNLVGLCSGTTSKHIEKLPSTITQVVINGGTPLNVLFALKNKSHIEKAFMPEIDVTKILALVYSHIKIFVVQNETDRRALQLQLSQLGVSDKFTIEIGLPGNQAISTVESETNENITQNKRENATLNKTITAKKRKNEETTIQTPAVPSALLTQECYLSQITYSETKYKNQESRYIRGTSTVEKIKQWSNDPQIKKIYLNKGTTIDHIDALPQSISQVVITGNTTLDVIEALNKKPNIKTAILSGSVTAYQITSFPETITHIDIDKDIEHTALTLLKRKPQITTAYYNTQSNIRVLLILVDSHIKTLIVQSEKNREELLNQVRQHEVLLDRFIIELSENQLVNMIEPKTIEVTTSNMTPYTFFRIPTAVTQGTSATTTASDNDFSNYVWTR